MKRLFTLLGSIGFMIVYSQTTVPPSNITTTENYVFSRTYLEPTTTSNTSIKQVQSVSYFDGLGRPKQSVAIKASPKGNDIVTTIPYDGFGRQVDSYFPVSMVSTNGGIQALDSTGVKSYYGSSPNGTTKDFNLNDANPFSHKVLENSPLDRIQQQYGAGESWRANSKKTEFFYETNGTEVKKYVTTFNYTTFTSTLPTNTNYAPETLYKNRVKDEDGNETIEYKNGEGQTILVRKVLSATENADTYYVYNDYNQLAFVIPPLAAAKAALSTTDLDNLCYQYRYDGRNRLVEKKLPGKGWEYMVYDRADRLILTQDTKLKVDGKWLLTKYDKLGRVTYTGIISGSDRKAMQDAIKDLIIVEDRDLSFFRKNGMNLYYTKHYYTDMEAVLSVHYYDSYPAETLYPLGNQILGVDILKNPSPTKNQSTQSLDTASYVKNIDNDGWTRNYIFYDKKGRSIGNYSYNHLGGYTKTELELDFAGIPQKTYTSHKRLRSDEEIKVKERFEYNQYTNALVKHFHEVVGKSPEVLLTENTYNEIGQLTNKKVGNNIQSIDYAYNIRGWLTGVNNPKSLNGKLFGFTINYQSPLEITNISPYSSNTGLTVEKKFNGNISEITWASGDTPTPLLKKYGYVYDKLNRLLAGFYYTGNQYTYNSENYEILNYDKNGNISDLKRSSFFSGTSSNLIDNLAYTYQDGNGNSNRLSLLRDNANNPSGYEGGGNPISYDDNGNMTDMTDKGISAIAYNFLNLPNQMNIQEGGISDITINTLYRADGTKLRKTNTTITTGVAGNATIVSKTDYVDGFQYLENTKSGNLNEAAFANLEISMSMEREAFSRESKAKPPAGGATTNNYILQFVPTAEGFYDFIENKYIYQYKDHLGNTRLSYAWNGTTNSIDVLDKNDYYPFGMNHLDSNAGSFVGESSYKNYKYNGKELQETGMYDYGARMYMPDIGRWGVVDPLAETMPEWSPYNFAFNNPIRYVDPLGLAPDDWVKKDGKWTWDDNITSAEQATTAGYDDYRAPGSIVDNATINGQSGGDGKTSVYLGQNANDVSHTYPNSTVTPFQVGTEWLSGEGPRNRSFTNGDNFTEMLKQHDHIGNARSTIIDNVANGGKLEGDSPYKLGGVKGVGLYLKDYSTLLTAGQTGNLAVTYLGSYNLNWTATPNAGNGTISVNFSVYNTSTMQSASRPPILGYLPGWQGTVGNRINNAFQTGWGSLTSQSFNWTETLQMKK